MRTEKPLHVRVAEALGMTPANMSLFPPGYVDTYADVPRYDTDWSATGPLMERYGISAHDLTEDGIDHHWRACWHSGSCIDFGGDTPLIAVCRLILYVAPMGWLAEMDAEIARRSADSSLTHKP